VTNPAQGLRAWSLTFRADAREATDDDVRLDLPESILASFKEIANPERLIESGNGEARHHAGLDRWEIVFLPAGSATPYAVQKGAEAWVSEDRPRPDANSLVEISLQNVRVLRADHRVVVIGTEDRSIRKGLAQFEWLNDRLSQLEALIAERWRLIEDDVKSFYANRKSLSNSKIGEFATEGTLARNWLVRAESILDRPDLVMPPLARRIFLELALRSEVTARIRAAERAIESTVAFYEYAFSHLHEKRDARKSLIIEFGILAAILLEVGLQLWR
jgi:hypothetical protein